MLILILLAGVLTLSPAVESQAQTPSARRSGFVLLRESVGSRAAAMGDASVAVPGDQPSIHTNPANAALLRGKDFVLSHNRSLAGIQRAYAGWAYGNGSRGIGLMLGVHSVGGLEARTGPTEQPLGSFSFYEINAGLTYSQRLGSRLFGGLNLRVLHEAIDANRTSGIAVDAGLLARTPVRGLDLGASVQNWGRTGVLGADRIRLPIMFRVGAALSRGDVIVAADGRFPRDGARGFHLGAEYRVAEVLFLRGGFQTGSDTRTGSFGVGLQRRNWRIAYAFVPSDLNLEGTHRIELGIR